MLFVGSWPRAKAGDTLNIIHGSEACDPSDGSRQLPHFPNRRGLPERHGSRSRRDLAAFPELVCTVSRGLLVPDSEKIRFPPALGLPMLSTRTVRAKICCICCTDCPGSQELASEIPAPPCGNSHLGPIVPWTARSLSPRSPSTDPTPATKPSFGYSTGEFRVNSTGGRQGIAFDEILAFHAVARGRFSRHSRPNISGKPSRSLEPSPN